MLESKYPITLIAAVAENGVIGDDGKLPWNIPEELQHFKKSTSWKPIIMGRSTMESLGRPLPRRCNIVLSKAGKPGAGWHVARNIEGALEIASAFLEGFTQYDPSEGTPDIMVIGGANVYEQFLPIADYLLLTRVKQMPEGDTYFPAYDTTQWELDWKEDFPQYSIERWRRLSKEPADNRFGDVLRGVADASK